MLCTVSIARGNVTVSGYVTDSETGEALIGANIYMKNTPYGAATNLYGFYSISLPPAQYNVVFSYIGYVTSEENRSLQSSQKMDIELSPAFVESESIVIVAKKEDANIQSMQMSTANMDVETIKKVQWCWER